MNNAIDKAALHAMAAIQYSRKHIPLQSPTLAADFVSGLLIYLLEVISVIAFAALVFSGRLASQLPLALGFILAADALLIGVTALFSSFPGSVSGAQDVPGVVLGVVVASSVATLPRASLAQQFATAAMMIVITTLMTGATFLGLGLFKLGGLARFLPYPVMGGFLAGTGWLLAMGGLGIMVGAPFGPGWFHAPALAHWLPGAIFGAVIFLTVTRIRNLFTLPVLLVSGTLLFYVVALAAHIPIQRLLATGWLVGSIPTASLSRLPLSAGVLSQVNWPVVFHQLPSLAPVAIIGVIALLLNASGLELVIKKDTDLNRELVVAGASNLAAGLVGGLVGYPAISSSALNYKMTGGKRLVGALAAALLGLTVLFGSALITYIPKFILGAVLVYLGLELLVEWVYQAWFKFPKIDFLIIVSVMTMIIVSGFLNGIIFGLALALMLFVVSYSRVSIVRFALSGRDYHSRVTRGFQQQQFLETAGAQLAILKLQGFLFFGTANSLFDRVREEVQRSPVAIRFVLLDFTQVSGLDSTGLLSFARMLQWTQERRVTLALTGMRAQAQAQFARGGFHEQPGSLRIFSDLDHGVEWCEATIIAESPAADLANRDLITQLQAIARGRSGGATLVSYLRRQEYAPGAYLLRHGEEPDKLYFVESGRLSAQLDGPGQAPVRLEVMIGGHIVGELGFFLSIPRTVAVIVEEPSVIYSLSTEALAGIEQRDPKTAILFYHIATYLLAERVVRLTRAVEALER
ncbi:MAG TPA: SulP family inorganic anion transporter [Ktedonobacterales bacterium]